MREKAQKRKQYKYIDNNNHSRIEERQKEGEEVHIFSLLIYIKFIHCHIGGGGGSDLEVLNQQPNDKSKTNDSKH